MQTVSKIKVQQERNIVNVVILVLLIILYAPLIHHWYDGWLEKSISIEHEYFSHGIIGLPYAAYLIWINRKKWNRLENKTNGLGAVFLGLGAAGYLTGVAEWVNLSFPLILIGLCLWLKGIEGLKLQGFTLMLVILATPNSIPYLIAPYTLPLQKFIAGVAGFILINLGYEVEVEQIYITVEGRLVEVAPYCAGLKMLFTSLYVALMLLHWTGKIGNRKKTITVLVGALGISVVGNIIRNTILTIFHGNKQDKLFEWLHDGWGGDLYSAGMLASILLVYLAMEKIYQATEVENIEEDWEADKLEMSETLLEKESKANKYYSEK